MKYKHDSLLPIHAFMRRGSVIGGRAMRLHGGDGGSGSGFGESDYDYQAENDRMELEGAQRIASYGNRTYLDNYYLSRGLPNPYAAPPPPPPPPLAPPPPPPPAAPAFTPYDLGKYGWSDETSDYTYAARLANLHMHRGNPDVAQQFIDQANAFIKQRDTVEAAEAEKQKFIQDQTAEQLRNYQPLDVYRYDDGTELSSNYQASAQRANWQMERGRPDLAKQFIEQANTYVAEANEAAKREQELQQKYGSVAFGIGMGPALGYAYETQNSEGNPFRRFDAQGNLTDFVDQHGQWQPASLFKPVGYQYNEETGQYTTQYKMPYSDIIRSGDIQPNKFHEDQGGFLGEGGWSRIGGLVAAGLTAGIAGGALSGIGLGVAPGGAALVPGSAAAIGTAAAQGALTSIAVSGLQGASPADMLKAGVIGGISAGAGNAIGGADLGAFETAVAKTGTQAGITAVAGGDVEDALISGIISSVLPAIVQESLPSDVTNVLSELPESVKKVVMSTASSVLNAGFNGEDISDAAVNGVANGLISLGKDFASGAFNNLTESEIASTVGDYLSPDTTAGGFLGEYEDAVETFPSSSEPDVINSIFRQDVDDVFQRNTPPLVQEAINLNTPVTAETVTTPPLIQQAINQNINADDVYRELVASYENPYIGEASTPIASAVSSDVNPVAIDEGMTVDISGANPRAAELLNIYNTGMREAGFPEASYDDESFIDWMSSLPSSYSTDYASDSLIPRISTSDVARLTPSEAQDLGIPAGLYSIILGDASAPSRTQFSPSGTPLELGNLRSAYQDILSLAQDSNTVALIENNGQLVSEALYDHSMKAGATPEQAQLIADAFINNPGDVTAFRRDVEQYVDAPELLDIPQTVEPIPPPLVQDAINRNIEEAQDKQVEPQKSEPVVYEAEPVKPEQVEEEKSTENDTKQGGSGTQGGSFAGDEGRVGAASPLVAAADSSNQEFTATDANTDAAAALAALDNTKEYIENESEVVATQLATLGAIDPVDIPIVMANLTESSQILNVTPTVAVLTELVQADGTLSDKGVEKVAADSGLSTQEVVDAIQGSSTIETSTGSGLKSDGAGAAAGTGTGVSGDEGLGGKAGEGIGGKGEGVGTGEGDGEGTGRGGGLPSSSGGARLVLNPVFPGALPGVLEGTYLKGVEVDEYDPFENYNTYQQLEPIRAAQGGSPLQLMQMQQGIVGYDPSGFSSVQYRPTPNYFTYGSNSDSVQPTTFAGSQLVGKPRPNIPVTPTGNIGTSDWLYGAAGANQLSPAGASLAALPSGMMANGGMAHGGGTDEHIPEFITGATGHYVRGRGDGQSDDIPAMLADGEYVFDSSSVSTLGNGSSDAGAKLLDAFRETLREHTRSAPKDKIPPKASPLQYMQEAMKKVGMK